MDKGAVENDAATETVCVFIGNQEDLLVGRRGGEGAEEGCCIGKCGGRNGPFWVGSGQASHLNVCGGGRGR